MFGDNLKEVDDYYRARTGFPYSILSSLDISEHATSFIRSLVAPDPAMRLRAKEALAHPWIESNVPVPQLEDQGRTISPLPILIQSPETNQPSNSWTTKPFVVPTPDPAVLPTAIHNDPLQNVGTTVRNAKEYALPVTQEITYAPDNQGEFNEADLTHSLQEHKDSSQPALQGERIIPRPSTDTPHTAQVMNAKRPSSGRKRPSSGRQRRRILPPLLNAMNSSEDHTLSLQQLYEWFENNMGMKSTESLQLSIRATLSGNKVSLLF